MLKMPQGGWNFQDVDSLHIEDTETNYFYLSYLSLIALSLCLMLYPCDYHMKPLWDVLTELSKY